MASQAAEEKITVLDNHRGAWTGMSSCGGRKRHEAAPFLGSLCKASDVENKGSQSRLQVGCSPTARSPGNPDLSTDRSPRFLVSHQSQSWGLERMSPGQSRVTSKAGKDLQECLSHNDMPG